MVQLQQPAATTRVAQQVLLHNPGRFTFQVELQQGPNQAAIRQLLQWAPPACLKLSLDGCIRYRWSALSILFTNMSTHVSSPDTSQCQRMPQFPCVSEVCVKSFNLPGLVPPGLAATCPNLHTLQPYVCDLQDSTRISSSSNVNGSKDNSNKGASSKPSSSNTKASSSKAISSKGASSRDASSSTSAATTDMLPAMNVHTLILDKVSVPKWLEEHVRSARLDNMRVTRSRSKQPAVQYVQQLRSSVPNIRCLTLANVGTIARFEPVLEPLVKELRLPQEIWLTMLQLRTQQVQKLVLQYVQITSPSEAHHLLSLPNLTHLELGSIGPWVTHTQADLSRLACQWRYLKVNWRVHLTTLATLPFHSLTQPLTLGCEGCDCILEFPPSTGPHSLALLQRLAQQLTRCGVKLLSPTLTWRADRDFEGTGAGTEVAPLLTALAPALGPHGHVQLERMKINQTFATALGAMHPHSLKRLTLQLCSFSANTQALWQGVLSGLPALAKLDLLHCWCTDIGGDTDKMTSTVRSLAMAMAQQPAGRCIDVVACDRCITQSQAAAEEVRNGVMEELLGVQVTAKDLFRTNKVGNLCGRVDVGRLWYVVSWDIESL